MTTIDPTYGICNLSVIPVRKDPSHKAEIGTQLLFGDSFTILKKSLDGRWLYVENSFDNYMGWIDFKQYKPISRDYFELVTSTEIPLCKELIALLQGENTFIPILFGTPLPFYKNGIIVLENEVYKFEGHIHQPDNESDFKFLEKIAFNYLHSPYLWGGKCHFGIDCSGFVQQVYRFSGIKLPRDAYQQAECGQQVHFQELKAGDLAFFQEEPGKVTHVGIILENHRIIHASGEVRIDALDEKGIFNAARKVYTHHWHSIKRVLA